MENIKEKNIKTQLQELNDKPYKMANISSQVCWPTQGIMGSTSTNWYLCEMRKKPKFIIWNYKRMRWCLIWISSFIPPFSALNDVKGNVYHFRLYFICINHVAQIWELLLQPAININRCHQSNSSFTLKRPKYTTNQEMCAFAALVTLLLHFVVSHYVPCLS